ncbi:MAG: hypothetical protein GX654_02210 [Desulfatiglans sp.]|jgi:class 3 adenylate cyclase|nr:hypothetical protein [Desulfatiglans sp.]
MALRDLLAEAQGRSEFVITVVADVRGFSSFSKHHESTDIGMFIKRFYMRLIDDYFKDAGFFKTKGDGVLMTFPYSEANLKERANYVINSCLQCLVEFPEICAGDPMINFKTPENIGFGIARGTACCLYAGDEIIDYSGHLLNLASRLMDMARPSGIVIDGNFMNEIIPEELRPSFKKTDVYIRSISEDKPFGIFYLEDYVRISEAFLTPMSEEKWHTIYKTLKMQEMAGFGNFSIHLPIEPKPGTEIKVAMIYPKMVKKRAVRGYRTHRVFKDFEYHNEAQESKITLDLKGSYTYLTRIGLKKVTPVQFKIQYVPVRPVS